jgi:hypothetical protein
LPEEAEVGTNKDVIVNDVGAVNQYPLTLPVNVPVWAGKVMDDAPLPLVVLGVTVIVAVTGTAVAFVAVNDGILPEPLAPRPIDVALFVQSNIVPATGPVKFTGAVIAPLQTVWLATGSTVGVGLTNTVAVTGVPGQPLAVGVIVKVTVIGALEELVSVPLMLPVPLAAIPVTVAVLSLVQLNVVPAIEPVKTIVVIEAPLQMV